MYKVNNWKSCHTTPLLHFTSTLPFLKVLQLWQNSPCDPPRAGHNIILHATLNKISTFIFIIFLFWGIWIIEKYNSGCDKIHSERITF